MSTVYTHNRGHRFGRGSQFKTRNEGHQRSKKVWICRSCWRWYGYSRERIDEPYTKPSRCTNEGCGTKSLLIFDSQGEAQRFVYLVNLQRAGEVRQLVHHPRFPLYVIDPGGMRVEFATYEADSSYERLEAGDWLAVVEDFKPKDVRAQDPVFKLKRKAFERQYGVELTIVN